MADVSLDDLITQDKQKNKTKKLPTKVPIPSCRNPSKAISCRRNLIKEILTDLRNSSHRRKTITTSKRNLLRSMTDPNTSRRTTLPNKESSNSLKPRRRSLRLRRPTRETESSRL